MSGTRYINLVGYAHWARLQEDNRDLGSENTPEDIQRKLDEVQGMYVMELHGITKAYLREKGVPLKGMMGQLLKETDDGEEYYKCKKPHFAPHFVDKETGEKGVVMGPPKVEKKDKTPWNWDSDGLIGNGSKVTITLRVWEGDKSTKIELFRVRVLEQVHYDPDAEEAA